MATSQTSLPLLSIRNLLLLFVWALGLFGTLQTHRWEGLFPHVICGPWGCGPPTSALVGYHGFWLLTLLLPAWLMRQSLSSEKLEQIGTGLLWIGIAGVVVVLSMDGYETLLNEQLRPYFFQRSVFSLATFVDVPIVQLGLIGLWLRSAGSPANKKQENVQS